jgi:hypothetical protein
MFAGISVLMHPTRTDAHVVSFQNYLLDNRNGKKISDSIDEGYYNDQSALTKVCLLVATRHILTNHENET